MKKNILFISLICCLPLSFTSCDEDKMEDIFYTEEAEVVDTQLSWKDSGARDVAFFNANEDVDYVISLLKTGNSYIGDINAGLIPLSQDELDAYNVKYKRNYTLLPAEYYVLPAKVTIAANVYKQDICVTFKKEIGNLPEKDTKQYVVPIRLSSTDCDIKENYDLEVLCLKITTPELALETSGIQQADGPVTADKIVNLEKKITLALNMDNKWDFTASLVTDAADLQSLVDKYNAENPGGEFRLLPAGYYTFGETDLAFTVGTRSRDVTVNISNQNNGAALSAGEYLLPVKLALITGMPFDVEEKVCFFHLIATNKLEKITITEDMIYAKGNEVYWNSDEKIKSAFDGDDNTVWQNPWCAWNGSGGNTERIDQVKDPKYGVYADVTLKAPVSDYIKFKYQSGALNTIPSHLIIYAGSNADDLEQVAEFNKESLPMKQKTWFESELISVKGIGTASLIRISFLESLDNQQGGTRKDLTDMTQWHSVTVSEIELWAN